MPRHIQEGTPVQIATTLEMLKTGIAELRTRGGRIAFVPTMGALHAGHMALVAHAQTIADHVVVSIFVNPKQFGPNEDLARYPRQETADADLLAAKGCALLWLPPVSQIYPDGFATTVSVARLGDGLCGAARPVHFDGVTTIVAKLFAQVRPDCAVFGEKDWQQLAIVRRMAFDLDTGVTVIGAPTVRDPDGLALSSRNAFLTPVQRAQACALPQALVAARDAIEGGAPVADTLTQAERSILEGGYASIDYVALVDADSLVPLATLTGNGRILAAARIGTTRLIDNFAVPAKK